MTRPRIGITTSYENGRQMLDHAYIRAIETAGALPIIVPMLATAEAVASFSELLDGLMISGGPGITRGLLGPLPDDLPAVDPLRDRADNLIYEALHDRPVLGICYGMQFINARCGGTIYGDLTAERGDSIAHSSLRGGREHSLHIERDSLLYDSLQTGQTVVNTHHIQALAEVGAGLRPVAFGPDGVVEAVESADGRLLGVQFHPERMLEQMLPLFQAFVARCGQNVH